MRTQAQKPAPFLFAVTALTTVFMIAPMLLSVLAGLVNNYSAGIKSGFTLRWQGPAGVRSLRTGTEPALTFQRSWASAAIESLY